MLQQICETTERVPLGKFQKHILHSSQYQNIPPLLYGYKCGYL